MLRGTTQLCARRRTLCNPVTWVIPSPPTILTVGSAALLPGELPASCPVRPLNLWSASLCQRMDGYFSGSRHLDASILPRKKGFCKGKICGIIKEKEGRAGHETAKLDPVEVHRVGNYVYMVAGSDYNALMKIMQENIG